MLQWGIGEEGSPFENIKMHNGMGKPYCAEGIVDREYIIGRVVP